jgi:hypothetical protein
MQYGFNNVFKSSGGGSYDLGLVDRFGNAFPTKTVDDDITWDLRTLTPYDWADLYLSQLSITPTSIEEAGIITYFNDMSQAGILSKRYAIYIYFGSTSANCGLNLKYPFKNDSSNNLDFVTGGTFDSNGFVGTAFTMFNPYNFNFLTNGGNIAFFSKNNVATNNSSQIFASGDSRQFMLRIDSPNNSAFSGCAFGDTITNATSNPVNRSGMWHVNHDINRKKLRHEGTNYINILSTMTKFPSISQYSSFIIREFSTARTQYTAFGVPLSEAEMDNERIIVNNLNIALSR